MNPSRRKALSSLAAIPSALQASDGLAQEASALEALVDSAFEYAFPMYEVARVRYGAVQNPANPRRHAPNTVMHRRELSDYRSRWVTTPNNDTLYSNAWLDLCAGPVQVRVGPVPAGRYWSVVFMDAFSNDFAMLGQRLDGTGPVSVALVGPAHRDAASAGRVIRAPGNDVWLLGRWLVDGPGDLPNSYAMQDSLQMLAPPAITSIPRVAPTGLSNPGNFLAVVNEQLARNPPPAQEAPLLQRWAVVGLRPGETDAWSRIGAAARAAWSARIGPAHAALRRAAVKDQRDVQGWKTRGPGIGNFGTNYALRAAVALSGLAALETAEAMYLSRSSDDSGQPLDGRNRYRLRVPAGGIPTDSFWSLSMYQPTPDGRLFFTENPIGRYSIGDRTPGLGRNADGTLDVRLQHEPPDDAALRANWLPAPAGPFRLALRAYLPRPELREGRAAMPTVIRL